MKKLTREQEKQLEKHAAALGADISQKPRGVCPCCKCPDATFTGATPEEVSRGDVACDRCVYYYVE
jgi:hypothetical protein